MSRKVPPLCGAICTSSEGHSILTEVRTTSALNLTIYLGRHRHDVARTPSYSERLRSNRVDFGWFRHVFGQIWNDFGYVRERTNLFSRTAPSSSASGPMCEHFVATFAVLLRHRRIRGESDSRMLCRSTLGPLGRQNDNDSGAMLRQLSAPSTHSEGGWHRMRRGAPLRHIGRWTDA